MRQRLREAAWEARGPRGRAAMRYAQPDTASTTPSATNASISASE